METTLPDADEHAPPDWCVFVAVHHDEGAVGRRRLLLRGGSLELGRESDALGDGALADARISRTHARLEVDAGGSLRVTDLGSSNGTYVNGARVERVTLAPGDVVRVGGVLLVVQRMPAALVAPAKAPLDGVGPSIARLATAVQQCARDRRTVLLVEEPGSGAEHVARALHDAHCPGEPFTELSLRGWAERLPVPLEDALASTEGGSVLLTALPPTGTLARTLLRTQLERHRARATDVTSPVRVLCVLDPRAAGEAGDLGGAPHVHTINVPPLRDRPEDLALIARAWARAKGVAVPALGHRAWLTLLRAPWPRNLAQLADALERAHAALSRGDDEDADAWISDARDATVTPVPGGGVTAPAALAPTPAPEGETYEIAASGKWFHLPGGERVSLHRREVLARALGALVAARRTHPGRVLRAEQLIESVWPGERFVEGAAQNRLHVTLSNLRQLGLRRLITRFEDGYRLDPSVPVRFVEE